MKEYEGNKEENCRESSGYSTAAFIAFVGSASCVAHGGITFEAVNLKKNQILG